MSASLMIVTGGKKLCKFKPKGRFHRILLLPAVMLASLLCSPQVRTGRGRCYHLWRRQKFEPISDNQEQEQPGPHKRSRPLKHPVLTSPKRTSPFKRLLVFRCCPTPTSRLHGVHPVRDHGSPEAAVPGSDTRPEGRPHGGGSGRVQHQPHAGLHLLQHQPGTIPAAARSHVSLFRTCRGAEIHIQVCRVSYFETVVCSF